MHYGEWKNILNEINSVQNSNIIDKIKEKLAANIYKKWKEDNFNVNHLFSFQDGHMGYECTLLHISACCGLENVVNVLLEQGAEVDVVDQSGKTPLHCATLHSRKNVVDALLTRGANINATDFDGKTLLHLAAEDNVKDMIEVLLARGIDVNIVDNEHGGTALHWAARSNHIEVLKILLTVKGIDVNAVDKYGSTALHLAASYDCVEIVRALLAAGVDINTIDNKHIGTPLHWAAGRGHSKVAKILLAVEGIDINAIDKYGDTALHRAAEYGNAELVKALLTAGAKVDVMGNDGTPLYYAALCNRTNVIKILLIAGANISLKNSRDQVPINHTGSCTKQFLKDAVNELHEMKNQTIDSTDISFYEFLQADKVKLASYTCDGKLYEKLKRGRYKNVYPIYASMIENQYKIIKRRCLEKKAIEPLGCFGTFEKNRQVKKTWEVLNEHICESIITYLTNIDLENVILSREKRNTNFLSRLSKWLK